jgi:ATP-dependent DNA ligase
LYVVAYPPAASRLHRANAFPHPPITRRPAPVGCKHDGFRLMARRNAAGVRLLTRNDYDWSARFPAILEVESALPGA